MWLTLSFTDAQKTSIQSFEFGEGPSDQGSVMEDIVWRNTTLSFQASYSLSSNISLSARYRHMNIRGLDVDGVTAQEYLDVFTPSMHHGKTLGLDPGLRIGF